MPERREGLSLALKAHQGLWIWSVEDLDGYRRSQPRVPTAIHGPLPSGSQDLLEDVGPESFSGLGELPQRNLRNLRG